MEEKREGDPRWVGRLRWEQVGGQDCEAVDGGGNNKDEGDPGDRPEASVLTVGVSWSASLAVVAVATFEPSSRGEGVNGMVSVHWSG